MNDTQKAALARIRAKYERRGKGELFNEVTRMEFLNAFQRVPEQFLGAVVEDMLLNPPKDANGREINWLPDPSDVVTVAKRFTEQGQTTASDVVGEVLEALERFGRYGKLVEGVDPLTGRKASYYAPGAPLLSQAAYAAVQNMGGWTALCDMEAPAGVWQGQLRRCAEDAIRREKERPVTLPALAGFEAIGRIGGGK